MKKFFTLLLLIVLACIVAGLYGIIHDQLTYTISPEYYTKFKFIQFGLSNEGDAVTRPRLMAGLVGIMATWWMGLIIGTILSLFALTLKDWRKMFSVTLRAMLLTITIAFAIGLVGLLFGYVSLSMDDRMQFYPYKVNDPVAFEAVGSMHNFSYAGGIIGLAAGIVYIIVQNKKRVNN